MIMAQRLQASVEVRQWGLGGCGKVCVYNGSDCFEVRLHSRRPACMCPDVRTGVPRNLTFSKRPQTAWAAPAASPLARYLRYVQWGDKSHDNKRAHCVTPCHLIFTPSFYFYYNLIKINLIIPRIKYSPYKRARIVLVFNLGIINKKIIKLKGVLLAIIYSIYYYYYN